MNLWNWLSLLLAVVNERRRDRQSRRKGRCGARPVGEAVRLLHQKPRRRLPGAGVRWLPIVRVGRQRDADSTPRRTSP